MRPVFAFAALVVCASAWPALAAPSPMFDRFERLCLSTRAEPAAVAQAAAREAGWTTVDDFPPAMLKAYGGPFDQATVRSRPAPDDDSILLVSGVRGPATSQAQVCTLSGPFDATVGDAAKAWLGEIKPINGPGPDGVYFILQTPTGRRAATLAEIKDPANSDKTIGVIVVTTPGEITTLTAFAGVER